MKTILSNIDKSLAENYPENFKTLNEPADQNLISKLQNFYSPVDELVELYTWHNGQSGFKSLNPKDNRTFLCIESSIKAHGFLAENYSRFKPSRIPILYNGAGDYVLYGTEGHERGKLFSFWHDDEEEEVEYTSLKKYLETVLENAKVQKKEEISAWTKVLIYLVQEPPDGLKGLKKIKETLNLSQGYSELKSATKKPNYLLKSGDYFIHVEKQVSELNKDFKLKVLEIKEEKDTR